MVFISRIPSILSLSKVNFAMYIWFFRISKLLFIVKAIASSKMHALCIISTVGRLVLHHSVSCSNSIKLFLECSSISTRIFSLYLILSIRVISLSYFFRTSSRSTVSNASSNTHLNVQIQSTLNKCVVFGSDD